MQENEADDPASALRAVFLVNFLAPNLVAVLGQAAQRFRAFRILASVAMEPNRNWRPTDAGLDVVVQKTWTKVRRIRHPSGFVDEQYVHVPYDTWQQLRRARPDVVISIELGARSVLASLYAQRHGIPHVLCVFASERTEEAVGRLRRTLRRWLAARVDVVTYDSDSCRRHLIRDLGLSADRVLPMQHAADPDKIHRGSLQPSRDDALRFLTIGQFVERKGVEAAAAAMSAFAATQPAVPVQWTMVGTGPLEHVVRELGPANLDVLLLGHLDPAELRELFSTHEVLLFPTLADEWGLVVDEALGSGLAVLGSIHSQAAHTLLEDGSNGFTFDAERVDAIQAALTSWSALSVRERDEMRQRARASVVDRTPQAAAAQLVDAAVAAVRARRRPRRT